jgi:hypothetical protein
VDESQDAFNELAKSILETAYSKNDLQLGIDTSGSQISIWTIRCRGADIPNGATGPWVAFGSAPREYAAWGLHGYTASVVTVSVVADQLEMSQLPFLFSKLTNCTGPLRFMTRSLVGDHKSGQWTQFPYEDVYKQGHG